MEGRNNQDKNTDMKITGTRFLCDKTKWFLCDKTKCSSCSFTEAARCLLPPQLRSEEWIGSWTADVADKMVPFFIWTSSSCFSSLILWDYAGKCCGTAEKNWSCLGEGLRFSHPQALEAGLLQQVVWEIWEDEYTYSSLVFRWNKLAPKSDKDKFAGQSGRRLTLGGSWWDW